MSKIGAHIRYDYERDGYAEFCGAKPSVIISVDNGGVLQDAWRDSDGHTITIFRDTTVYGEAPGDLFTNKTATTEQIAQYWYPKLKAKWIQNPADYYQPTNEQAGNDPEHMKILVRYEREIMRLANADGLYLCVLNLAGGTAGVLEQWKEIYVPFIKEAGDAGNIYGRHAYGGQLITTPDGNTNRPFVEAQYLLQEGITTGIVVTELGFNGGYGYVGNETFIDEMIKYSLICEKSYSNIIGICPWTLGNNEFNANWQSAAKELAAWMAQHPTDKWKPDDGGTEPPPPEGEMTQGIDVSKYQGAVNWTTVASRGTEFAFIRAVGEGVYKDPTFDANWQGAKQNGILRGAYMYYTSDKDPIRQAEFFMESVPNDYELPLVVDVEGVRGADANLGNRVLTCLKHLEEWTGVRPIIYTAAWFWNPYIGNVSWAKDYDLWVANYTGASKPVMPVGWNEWKFWQYSSTGDGWYFGASSDNIDLNRFNGSLGQLLDYTIKDESDECIEINDFTRTFLLHPKHGTKEVALFVADAVFGDGIQVDDEPEKREIGEAGWSTLSAIKTVRDAVLAGKTNSRLLILDGDAIGTGLNKSWMAANCPLLLPYTRWYESGSAPEPPPPPEPEKIDLTPYIIGDGRRYYLANWNKSTQELLQCQRSGDNPLLFYQVKNNAWESFLIDGDIRRDTDISPGGGRFYTQREGDVPARWLPLSMAVGEEFTVSLRVQFYQLFNCAPSAANSGNVTDTRKLVAHHPTWTSRHGIALNDVIQIEWVNGGEVYYYAKNYGLVQWERKHQDPNSPAWTAVSEIVNDNNNNYRMRGCFGGG